MIYLLVGTGGIIGSLLRYYLGVFTHSWWGYDFPLGTLLINLIGCFVLGWFTSRIVKLKQFHPHVLAGLGTGLVGSFTTFSTFSVETVTLIQHHLAGFAFLYVLLSLFGGLMMSWLGYDIGHRSFKRLQRKGE
ncbi:MULTISPECIES: fluoride efflux transporter CrcB [Bacillus]|uniref:Fluoride-specific ion channel FluC n=3 Tax=Bacteria TaxID=2 RepID=A0A2G8IQL4_BACPU|nr:MULTISPECIES: fluoride efflux transporter CrcB [Bacillus]MCC9087320.1 fluoride efflux transporter CrcB [Bacillus pumilus]MED1749210.1 fluoride efflux transporter CrcB [Bacillus zhangzhouensis]PIK25796.1 fluoride efflux transporter CrcB [Bacillus pumilus]UUD44326.1 fluoride efflux transporter CrcB [Bacillus pumilus]